MSHLRPLSATGYPSVADGRVIGIRATTRVVRSPRVQPPPSPHAPPRAPPSPRSPRAAASALLFSSAADVLAAVAALGDELGKGDALGPGAGGAGARATARLAARGGVAIPSPFVTRRAAWAAGEGGKGSPRAADPSPPSARAGAAMGGDTGGVAGADCRASSSVLRTGECAATEADADALDSALRALAATQSSPPSRPYPPPYSARASVSVSPQRDYVEGREWAPAGAATLGTAAGESRRGDGAADGYAAAGGPAAYSPVQRVPAPATASPAPAASSRALFLHHAAAFSRALGLVGASPLALSRAVAAAACARGRVSAPALVAAVVAASALVAGAATADAARARAAAFVAAVWAPLAAASAAPGGRPLSTGDVDFRLALAALLPLAAGAPRAARASALWSAWRDGGGGAAARGADALTERTLARALAGVVAGAAAASALGADAAGAPRARAVDAAATGRTLAAMAFRDVAPGGAPATMTAALFCAWERSRDVDVLGGGAEEVA
jgi:hypothetical protein